VLFRRDQAPDGALQHPAELAVAVAVDILKGRRNIRTNGSEQLKIYRKCRLKRQ
jgi:hypothetical protein